MAFDFEGYHRDRAEIDRQAEEMRAARETQANMPEQNTEPWYSRAYDAAAEAWGNVITAGSHFIDAYGDVVRDRLDAVERANETGDYTGTYAFNADSQEAAAQLNEAGGELVSAATQPLRNNVRYMLGSTIGETVNAYANEGSEFAQGIRDNATFVGYLMTDEARLRKAREIEDETGISAEMILSDDVAYKQALKIDDYMRKQKALMQDGFSMEAVWKEYPEIKDIANMNPQDAALALHHIEAVRSTHGIVDTFTRFLETGNKKLELDNLSYKIAIGAANENDRQRAEDLKAQIEAEEKEAPSFFDDPAAAIAAGLAQSSPEMVQSFREGVEEGLAVALVTGLIGAEAGSIVPAAGTAAGGAVGGIGGFLVGVGRSMSARAARRELIKRAVQIGMFNGMARPEIGSRFDEYRNMKDESGNRLFTDDQARGYAFVAGSANAAIEMANFGVAAKALKGSPHAAKVFGDIIGRAGTRLSAREELSRLVRGRAADTLKITASEAGEEGLQSISDDLVHNVAVSHVGRGDLRLSTKEIAADAFVSMAEALPGALGFGIAGAGGGTLTSGARLGRAMYRQAKADTKYGEQARQTMMGTIMLERLQQAAGSSSLQNVAPDVQRKVLRNQLQGTGYETAYVDVEMAKEQEHGIEDIKKVGEAAGYTPQQIEKAIETNGHLMIPVEQFAQVKTSPDMLDAVSFAPEADSMARMRRDAKAVMEQMKKNNIAAAERQEKLTDKMLDEYLPVHEDGSVDADGRNLMKAAIYTNPTSPAQGWRDMHKQLRAELDEYIAPALARLKEGMGRGGQILRVEDENGQEKYVRGTENDPWYSAFYKEHKRRPTAAELEDMAVDMTTGKSSLNIDGFTPRTAEEAEAMAEAAPAIENLRKTLAVMERIKPHMKEMTGAEMRLTEGLSHEAFHVYRDLTKKLTEIGGQTAPVARLNAILFARHADIFADIVSKKTGDKLTAKDYYERFFGLDSEGKYKADLHQAMMPDIDLNEKVPVLDMDSMTNRLAGKTDKDILAYIRDLAPMNPIPTADFRALVGLPKDRYGRKHLIRKTAQRNVYAQNVVLSNIKDVLPYARVIEVVPNEDIQPLEGLTGTQGRTQRRKNAVKNYYRIMLPIKIDGRIETLALIAEDRDGQISVEPQNVSLYEIFVPEKKKALLPASSRKRIVAAEEASSATNIITQDSADSNSDEVTIRDMLSGIRDYYGKPYINSDGTGNFAERFDQIAWHGSPYWFEHFDLGMIGAGVGAQAHGWGLYFAADRKAAEVYRGVEGHTGGLYQVEIPDDDVLLNEDATFSEQPVKVRRALNKLLKDLTDEQLENWDDVRRLGRAKVIASIKDALMEADGKNIYGTIADLVEGEEEASKLLNAYGIQGIACDDSNAGRMFVVFDDKAISIIETYNQMAWHGSPHTFYEFLLSAINSGEGAQAHGWGLYFAKFREVAERYRGELAGDEDVILYYGDRYENTSDGWMLKDDSGDGGNIIDSTDPTANTFDAFARAGGDVKEAIKELQAELEEIKENLDEDESLEDDPDAVRIQETIEVLENDGDDMTLGDPGSLFQVEIPDDDVLLEEDQDYADQRPKVKAALDKLAQHWETAEESSPQADFAENYKNMTGEELYRVLSRIDGDQYASELLNEYGIEGIAYNGGRDGRCYVIFNDAVIQIVERLEQEARRVEQGYISRFSNGQRIVTLLKDADASTFHVEMGHLFLYDLEYLAKYDETSAKELELVNKWAEWHEGAAKEYARTDWAKEFADREAAILTAQKKGDTVALEKLKKEWRQERFARAFEVYLYDGKAPAKGLRAVFRKFKTFLMQVYNAVRFNDGVRASLEVQRVMDRMIASEEEIDAAALEDVYRDVEKAGGEKLFTESEEETRKRWYDEAQAEAEDTIRKALMKDMKEKALQEFGERVAYETERKEKELQNMPVYLAEAALAESGGDKGIVTYFGFRDIDEYRAEREKAGSLDAALNAHMAAYQQELDREMKERHLTPEAVDMAMMGSEYRAKLAALTEKALRRKMMSADRVTEKTAKIMQSVEEKLTALPDDADLQLNTPAADALKKALDEMKVAEKWTPAEYAELQKVSKAATKEAFRSGFDKFKEAAKKESNKAREKEKHEALAAHVTLHVNDGQEAVYRDMARAAIAEMSISDACNVNRFIRAAKNSKKRFDAMFKAKRWDMAMAMQRETALNFALAHESEQVRKHVDKLTARVRKQLTARSVRLPAEERYWHRHLAYILRLTKQDVKMPAGMKETSFYDTLKRILTDLDASDDFNSALAMGIALKGEDFPGYRSLNLDEYTEMVDMLTMLYTTGRDRFKMKTVAGKDIADIVDEIVNDRSDAQNIKRLQMVVGPDRGGMGYNDLIAKVSEKAAAKGQQALAAITKPEEVLRALGENAHRYIYGTYERAAEKEGAMLAAAHESLKKILEPYTHDEMMKWKKKSLRITPAFGGEISVTKENIVAMALNMGNATNLQRLAGSLKLTLGEGLDDAVKAKISEDYVKTLVEQHMTEKDWKLVQDIWDYIDTFWKETAEVEEKLNGVTLEKVKARAFTVRSADGKEIKMRGGYYPISYDPEKSARAEEQEVNENAKKGMSGAQVLGTRRSHTKKRSEGDITRPMRLDMRVLTEHIDNAVHNIAYRIAARDVYRLINNEAFQNHVYGTLGEAYYKILKEWSTDVWSTATIGDNRAQSLLDQAFGALRRNSVIAIMGYRMWPVIENASNLAVCMDKIGTVETIGAIGDFYANWHANRDLLRKSVFMSNRINDMERDIKQDPRLFDRTYRPAEILRDHAYTMMKYSDLMLSAPTWVRAYKNAYTAKVDEVKRENEENIKAFADAQARRDDLRAQLHDAHREEMPDAQKIEQLQKELWKAEIALDKAAELPNLTDAEVLKEAERRAVFVADGVIRDTFGSGRTLDLASMSRSKNEVYKLMTTFYSFFNTQFNAVLAQYRHAKFGGETGIRRWAPLARTIMFRMVFVGVIGGTLQFALGLDGDDDKDKYRMVKDPKTGKTVRVEVPAYERLFKVIAKNALGIATGSLVGVRDIAKLAMDYLFEGNAYGRGLNPFAVAFKGFGELGKMVMMIAEKGERDLKIEESEEKRKEKQRKTLKRLHGRARQEYLARIKEDEKYRTPAKPITYSEILRHGLNAASTFTAASTGVTNTMVDAVTGAMMYGFDDANRYDMGDYWVNFWRTVLFDKKPRERAAPQKPEKPKKNKRNERRSR